MGLQRGGNGLLEGFEFGEEAAAFFQGGIGGGVIAEFGSDRVERGVDGGVGIGEEADKKIQALTSTVGETGLAIEFGEIAIARITIGIDEIAGEE